MKLPRGLLRICYALILTLLLLIWLMSIGESSVNQSKCDALTNKVLDLLSVKKPMLPHTVGQYNWTFVKGSPLPSISCQTYTSQYSAFEDDSFMNEFSSLQHPVTLPPLCTVFTNGEMKKLYGDMIQGVKHSGDPQLTFVWFMKRFTKYDFFWILEDDVRYIGRWSDLFAQVRLASRSAGGKNQTTGQKPDLISFEDICEPIAEWGWYKTCEHIWKRTDQRHTMGVLWGWSKALVDAMDTHIQAKENCYYEVFPTSVAHNHNLTSLFVPHTLFNHTQMRDRRVPACPGASTKPLYPGQETVPGGFTFSADDPFGPSRRFYTDWKDGGGCFPNMLLHAVKNV
ncbi:hypothetical protein BCR33DRAFT_713737 [Rhizoclosmatium globosum]|uniref:Nucleotide-diphospho-sugar transferase n=1 Tax=Rhizoclosmatium globosum TaxID=329046 RepID=A0A1Y2CQV7_9FUNG|nr:hypothetical protein BCR33DRAFT_713737 [Rhizoclosmatium globosum]|eukprot:ORY49402.1 hypothetical protein BCR33DRAFT_713737 [Rhizoclosmatium globosum]